MTAAFIEKNMIGLMASIAILIGADLSTTIIAQILIFDLSWLSPALIAVGAIISLKRSYIDTKIKASGNILVGLGLILMSLSLIREISAPLKESQILTDLLLVMGNDAFMTIFFSALITVIIHSSLATVLFYATLASQHVISVDLGLMLIIGANIGGALIPYLATLNGGPSKKRLMVTNIIMRSTTAIILIPFIGMLSEPLSAFTEAPERTLVVFHTGFNILLALIFLPIIPALSAFMHKVIKSEPKKDTPSYLDDAFLERPSLALSSAVRETLRMADLIEAMTGMCYKAIKDNDEGLLRLAKKQDDELDIIYKKVTLFLTRLDQDALTKEESDQYERIMSFATNLEHSGDVIQHSMSKTIAKKIKLNNQFSEEGWKEIKIFYDSALENTKSAQSVFISGSTDMSESMINSKKRLKQVELSSRRSHFARLSDKNPDSLATSGVHIDLIRDLGRINSYVTSIAYETLNQAAPDSEG